MSTLNSEQQVAVDHIEGPLLVLAGAGSGKTRIVTHRIAHLLNIGVPASEILAVTFTNKAAEEMRERIRHLCNQMVLTSTFHSLGARILRESISHLGFDPHFHIYDSDDSLELVKQTLRTLDLKDEKGLSKSVKNAISFAKNELKGPKEIAESAFDDALPDQFPQIFQIYQQKLKEYNAVDFDDLLYLPVKLFREFPDVLHHYQRRWTFLLIDEYQDTNQAQYTLSNLLSETHRNIFAVGDPDQSIYSWRGANIQNILSFERDFPGARVITLDQNYRSTNHILQAANALISHNTRSYEKNLWSDQGDGAKIGHFIAGSDREEADFVISRILEHHEKDDIPLEECVIFYRTNFQSRLFEDALLRRRLPYQIIGGISFYERREIKDLLAYLRVVISDYDFLSFVRTINLPKRGVGNTTILKLKEGSETLGIPIIPLCRTLLREGISSLKLTAKQLEGVKSYIELILELRELVATKVPLNAILREAIHRSGYLEFLKNDPESLEDRKENLEELISKAAEWEMENEGKASLSSFLEELTLKTSQDDNRSTHGAIRMMTLHNSKGLEFKLACIVGMEEDLLPHTNAKNSFDAVEEERRLCYVGITRARRFLYLTASNYRFLWGSSRIMRPSRFLNEIPRMHLKLYHTDLETEAESHEGLLFEPEDFVFHKDFGKGIVQKRYQTTFGITYDVYFPHTDSTRTLVAKYAKLCPA